MKLRREVLLLEFVKLFKILALSDLNPCNILSIILLQFNELLFE